MQGFDRQAAVRFENVEKNFGDVKVLRNFDLEVQPGEFVVLLGFIVVSTEKCGYQRGREFSIFITFIGLFFFD